MVKTVIVPLSDGSHRLHKLQQIWIELVAEMMRIGAGIDQGPSANTKSFAKNNLFSVVKDKSKDLSVYAALQIEHALRLFRIPASISACSYQPHKKNLFASVKLSLAESTVYLWVSSEEPFAVCNRVEEKNPGLSQAPVQHDAPGKSKRQKYRPVTTRRSPSPVFIPEKKPDEFWKNLLGEYAS